MRKTLFAVLLTALFAAPLLADIPRPKTTPKQAPPKDFTGKMYIDLRSDAKVPTLQIRREVLDGLRASLDQNGETETAASWGAISRTNTIVAGALLSVALVFGGFLAMRGNTRFAKAAVPLAIVAAAGLGALTVYANTPPPRITKITSRIFDENTRNYGYANDQVVVKIIEKTPGVYSGLDDKDVILEIPKAPE